MQAKIILHEAETHVMYSDLEYLEWLIETMKNEFEKEYGEKLYVKKINQKTIVCYDTMDLAIFTVHL